MRCNLLSDQWISFEVGTETYVHSVDKIKEIIPYASPVPVPGSPCFAEGILNVRGNVVTVLSSRLLLDLQEARCPEEGRIMILEVDGEQFGISVDSVGHIIDFQSGQAEWSDQGKTNSMVKGTLYLNDQLYILADFSGYADMFSKIS